MTTATLPRKLLTSLARLRASLAKASVAVFDFETDGLDTRKAIPCGAGFFLPELDETYYINVGHRQRDPDFPLSTPADFVAVAAPFFSDPTRHAIAHNAAYDVRLLFQLGVHVACRVSCSMTHAHRCDENLSQKDNVWSDHEHTKVSYGLKELTTVYFGERPPTLVGTIGRRNAIFAPPRDVALYCALDVRNTWRLYERCREIIDREASLRRLTDEVDDPNQLVVAKMLWDGIGFDAQEATRQERGYDEVIDECRRLVWRAVGRERAIKTPDEVRSALRELGVGSDAIDDDSDELPDERDVFVSAKNEAMARYYNETTDPKRREGIAGLLAIRQAQQRQSNFLRPLRAATSDDERLRVGRFSSLLVTTRFSSSPNIQNLPGKSDKGSDPWRDSLPPECNARFKTRRLFNAARGSLLVQADYKSAEPRYLAMLFEKALADRGAWVRSERRRLDQLASSTHPKLWQLKLQTAKPMKGLPPTGIEFPSYRHDPLWEVFASGGDPYDALLTTMLPEEHAAAVAAGGEAEWLKENRAVGKRAFLALGYGSSPASLAPVLGWSVERTKQAIDSMKKAYATLEPLLAVTAEEVTRLGEVRTLWGRPRRLNGYWQLARPEWLTIQYTLARPTRRTYQMRVLPLGSTAYGTQAFVEWVKRRSGDSWSLVWSASPAGQLLHLDKWDAFVRNVTANHFNRPPFANLAHRCVQWVRDGDGVLRELPRLEDAQRQAFNARCQATGADHLRVGMNDVDRELLVLPEFAGVRLVLTVHDSLVYEAPEGVTEAFARRVAVVLSRRPEWATIDFPVEVEVGPNLGQMTPVV